MKYLFLIVLGLSMCFKTEAQSNFPKNWLGTYEGLMYMEYVDGIKDTVPITFEFLATDTVNRWTYRMTYNSRKWGKLVKDYQLFWHDSLKSPNVFLLDEKDGIYIQELFMNNRFYSHFEVGGGHFVSVLEQKGKDLYFEIRCSDVKLGKISSATEGDETYVVSNYFTYTIQYATLKKVKSKKDKTH